MRNVKQIVSIAAVAALGLLLFSLDEVGGWISRMDVGLTQARFTQGSASKAGEKEAEIGKMGKKKRKRPADAAQDDLPAYSGMVKRPSMLAAEGVVD
jgi:hypothetical protein